MDTQCPAEATHQPCVARLANAQVRSNAGTAGNPVLAAKAPTPSREEYDTVGAIFERGARPGLMRGRDTSRLDFTMSGELDPAAEAMSVAAADTEAEARHDDAPPVPGSAVHLTEHAPSWPPWHSLTAPTSPRTARPVPAWIPGGRAGGAVLASIA